MIVPKPSFILEGSGSELERIHVNLPVAPDILDIWNRVLQKIGRFFVSPDFSHQQYLN